jgi:hypothetical protein
LAPFAKIVEAITIIWNGTLKALFQAPVLTEKPGPLNYWLEEALLTALIEVIEAVDLIEVTGVRRRLLPPSPLDGDL